MATAMNDDGGIAGFEALHARPLRHFPDLVMELGGAPDEILISAGLTAREGEPITATYRQQIALMEEAARRLGCPDFGLRLAQKQHGGAIFGPLGRAMQNSRTFGEAISYVTQHIYAHSLAASVWTRPIGDAGEIMIGHDILLDGVACRTQAMEQILLDGHLTAQDLTGGKVRVRRVHFRHQPMSSASVYRRAFGCEVRFGQQEDAVVYHARDMAAPIINRDDDAYGVVTRMIDQQFTRQTPPLHAQVRGLVMHRLGYDDCSNAHIAARLNMLPRTLHRRLRREGTSFQRVKDEVRRDMMLYYLGQTDFDLSHISERLGFAEQSVMTRFCRHWFAASPTEMRARQSAPAA